MRYLVISDIHANAEAFEAVLAETAHNRDAIICLGDLVGYGPYPDECVELAQKHCAYILAGNHDLAACGKISNSSFSAHAAKSLAWTIAKISASTRSFLASLPPSLLLTDLMLSHGSPADPVWGYILSGLDAQEALYYTSKNLVFFGHTHIPSAFCFAGEKKMEPEIMYGVPQLCIQVEQKTALLNPGSVGFPRDADDAHAAETEKYAAARYALYDENAQSWTFYKTTYDMSQTARLMHKEGLW